MRSLLRDSKNGVCLGGFQSARSVFLAAEETEAIHVFQVKKPVSMLRGIIAKRGTLCAAWRGKPPKPQTANDK